MLRSLVLAFGDLGDRRMMAILARSLGITLLLFAGIGVALGWLSRGADPCDWLGLGNCPLDAASGGIGAVLLTGIALWLLFPPVALGVIASFTDDIVAVVEARHYPARLARARRLGWIGGALMGLRGSLRVLVLVYNILALPLYIVLLVTGIGPIILFVLVNGLALGSDLGGMVAARHDDRRARAAWMRATRLPRALIGVAVTAMFLVPFVNLLAPLVGAAAMAHLYHGHTDG